MWFLVTSFLIIWTNQSLLRSEKGICSPLSCIFVFEQANWKFQKYRTFALTNSWTLAKKLEITFWCYGVLPVIRQNKACSIWVADNLLNAERVGLMSVWEWNLARSWIVSFECQMWLLIKKALSKQCFFLLQNSATKLIGPMKKGCHGNRWIFHVTTKEWFQNEA